MRPPAILLSGLPGFRQDDLPRHAHPPGTGTSLRCIAMTYRWFRRAKNDY